MIPNKENLASAKPLGAGDCLVALILLVLKNFHNIE